MIHRVFWVCILIGLLVPLSIQAQNMYLKVGGKYHTPFSKQVSPEYASFLIPFSGQSQAMDNLMPSYTQSGFSVAKGFSWNAAWGYNVSKTIALEMPVEYFGSQFKIQGEPGVNIFYYPTTSFTSQWKFRSLSLTPSVVYKHEWSSRYTPYMRAGVSLAYAWLQKSVYYQDLDDPAQTQPWLIIDTNPRLSVGYDLSIGLQRTLYKNLSVGFELGTRYFLYTPRKATGFDEGSKKEYTIRYVNERSSSSYTERGEHVREKTLFHSLYTGIHLQYQL